MRRLLIALLALALPGCFEPDYQLADCELKCTDESGCPGDFECDRGVCVSPGNTADQCVVDLSINVEGPTLLYTCEPTQLEFTTDEGDEPLQWSMEAVRDGAELPSGLTLDSDTGALSADPDTLSADPNLEFRVVVEDEHRGRGVRAVELEVRDCVEVVTDVAEPFCSGDTLEIPLLARGGSGDYAWSLMEQAPGDLELEIRDGALTGTLGDDSVGTHRVVVQAEDADREDADVAQLEVRVVDCPRIEELETILLCAGQELDQRVAVSGGVEPFAWASGGLPDGVGISQGELSGTADSPGSFQAWVQVTDDMGEEDTAELQVVVQACPEIFPDRIQACESVEIFEPIKAVPESEQLVWSVLNQDDLPDWLSFDTQRAIVSGTPDGADEFDLRLRVGQAGGATQDHAIAIAVYDRTSSLCEQERRAIAPRLPDACVGKPYVHTLRAPDGLAVEGWLTGAAWPEWLDLDEQSGELTGTPQLATQHEFSVEVVGESRTQLSLQVRAQCEYGFLGDVSDSTRLFLGDVRQALGDAAEPIEVSASIPEQQDVEAFEFAPDGRRIAFTSRDDQAARDALWLAQLAASGSPVVAPLPTADELRDVRHFAWSTDSAWLALLYLDDTEQQRFAVFDVSGEDAVAGDDIPVEAFDPSGLFWLGAEICYIGPNAGIGYFVPYCHTVSAAGELGAAQQIGNAISGQLFDDPDLIQVLGSPDSIHVFAATDSTDPFLYYQFLNSGAVSGLQAHPDGVPDPSWSWVADPASGQTVDIFPLGADLLEGPNNQSVAHATVSGCARIDAWEQRGRALACSADDGLRIALLDGTQLTQEQDVADSDDFADRSLPKAFTPDASWFVYDTVQGDLMAVDLGAEAWTALPIWSHPPNERLAFTPLESEPTRMLVQAGMELWVALPEQGEVVALSEELALNEPFGCTGGFQIGGPSNWCGGRALPAQYAAFPDGSAVLFPGPTVGEASGNLILVDIATALAGSEGSESATGRILVNSAFVDCRGDGCSEELKLAPPPR